MRKAMLLAGVLLLPFALGTAQTGDKSQSGEANQATIQGCLMESAPGTFVLNDESGAIFYLTGDHDLISKHAGQKVQLSGRHTSPVIRSSSGYYSTGTREGTLPSFEVKAVTKTSGPCKS